MQELLWYSLSHGIARSVPPQDVPVWFALLLVFGLLCGGALIVSGLTDCYRLLLHGRESTAVVGAGPEVAPRGRSARRRGVVASVHPQVAAPSAATPPGARAAGIVRGTMPACRLAASSGYCSR